MYIYFSMESTMYIFVLCLIQATDTDLGRNSYDVRTVRNCFRQSFIVLTEAQYDWQHGQLDKSRSILEYVIYPHDKLFHNRIRFPIRFNGESKLEKTAWWKDVRKYFNKPIASLRPPPILPKSIIQQVRSELEAEKGKSIEDRVKEIVAPFSRRSGKRKASPTEYYDESHEISRRSYKRHSNGQGNLGLKEEENSFGYNPEVDRTKNSRYKIEPNYEPDKQYRHSPGEVKNTINEALMVLESSETKKQMELFEKSQNHQNRFDTWD